MRIINTFDTISSCFIDDQFDLEAWRKYTKTFSCELSEKCEQDSEQYDFKKEVVPVVNDVFRKKGAACQANASFLAVTKQLSRNTHRLFQNEMDMDIILYLGLCNGAGWATTLDGRDAVLLGIEKIIELNWQSESSMQALLFHELGHIWHKTYGVFHPETHTAGENTLVQLYQEGIAMVCEQILCQNDCYYHQNQEGWLEWCTANQAEIKQEYLYRIDHNISAQGFFGDWCQFKGHSDVGYYLGCEFIKYLQQKYSLVEIANLKISQLYQLFKTFAALNG